MAWYGDGKRSSRKGGPMWRDEYERLLRDPSPNAFQTAVQLKARYRPQAIYKYRGVCDDSLDSLRRGYVWLSHPQSFNDGYDSAMFVDHDRLLAESVRRSMRQSVGRFGLSDALSEADIRSVETSDDPALTLGVLLLKQDPALAEMDHKALLDGIASVNHQQAKDFDQATREMARASILVCSFATSGATPALWAHYAGNGAGFCIEYDLDRIPPDDIRLRLLVPVIYGPAPLDATFLFEHTRDHGPSALAVRWPILAATFKDPQWSNEQEWRLIDPSGNHANGRAVPMPMKAVYLGTATSPGDAAEVARAAKEHGVPVHRMQVGKNASALSVVAAT